MLGIFGLRNLDIFGPFGEVKNAAFCWLLCGGVSEAPRWTFLEDRDSVLSSFASVVNGTEANAPWSWMKDVLNDY